MSKLNKCLAVVVLSVFATSLVMGQNVTSPSGFAIDVSITGLDNNNATFSATGEAVCPDAVAVDATLKDAATFKFFMDTTSDPLVIDVNLNVETGTLFNVPVAQLGSDVGPPNPALLFAFPTLKADTYFTTPGATSLAGAVPVNGDDDVFVIFDTVDSGPQSGFQFGQVTLIPNEEGMASATIRGTLQTAADPTPVFDNFEATLNVTPVPEPGSLALLSMAGLFGLLSCRRRRKR